MNLYIKNMICRRCIIVIEQELTKLHLYPLKVELGKIEFEEDLNEDQISTINQVINELGFELLNHQKEQITEKIKFLLIQKIQKENIPKHFSIIHFVSDNLHKDYSYLSKLFSKVEGITIEQFFILQKIEKAKELLSYNELALSNIAKRLGYGSIQHFSTQFKKVTSVTPSSFKNYEATERKPLDEVINQ